MAPAYYRFLLGMLTGIVVVISFSSLYDSLFAYVGLPISNKSKRLPPPHVIVKNVIKRSPGILVEKSLNEQVDDYSAADIMFPIVRVLCMVMTSPKTLQSKALRVYNSWAYRCNIALFFSSESSDAFPAPVIKLNVPEEGTRSTATTYQAFKYVYDNYYEEADWFIIVDDNTFMIAENLRYFLADKSPRSPVYYGHPVKGPTKAKDYNFGGAGYVLSLEALVRLAANGLYKNSICMEGEPEDVLFGKCMEGLGVEVGRSFDHKNGSRFHGFSPPSHIKGSFPAWYKDDATIHGVDSLSDYAVTFHSLKPKDMDYLVYMTYHLKVYGVHGSNTANLHKTYPLQSDT